MQNTFKNTSASLTITSGSLIYNISCTNGLAHFTAIGAGACNVTVPAGYGTYTLTIDGIVIPVQATKKGDYEAGTSAGGQTREHIFLAYTLGVGQIVVGITKMDDPTVQWSQKRYEEVRDGIADLLKITGYKIDKINFIPISGWTGDNMVEPSKNMPWYKGPTMLAALDTFIVPPKPVDKPFRMPVEKVYTITGVGTVPVGRVETGIMRVGDQVITMPEGVVGEVRSIETHHTNIQQAEPGDNIGFSLKGIAKKDIRRGDVLGPASNPPTVAKEFLGQIIVINHPTAIAAGYTPVLHAHTAQVAATIVQLVSKIDPRTGQPTEEAPKSLKTGDSALVKIQPLRPLCIETFKEFPELGRFALRDMGATIAAGVVKEITQRWEVEKTATKP
jgi:elongation factor 1-alpha